MTAKIVKKILKWLLFQLESIASDHFESRLLPLLWMLVVSILYSITSDTNVHIDKNLFAATTFIGVLPLCVMICTNLTCHCKKHMSVIWLSLILVINYAVVVTRPLNTLLHDINPFRQEMSLGLLFLNLILVYLIYQLIRAIRKDRRE